MTDRCRCYGTMFPDFTRLQKSVPLTSPAFSAQVENQGMAVQGWKLEVERAGWEKCVACTDYRTCYDLSLARLLMNTLMANEWYGK